MPSVTRSQADQSSRKHEGEGMPYGCAVGFIGVTGVCKSKLNENGGFSSTRSVTAKSAECKLVTARRFASVQRLRASASFCYRHEARQEIVLFVWMTTYQGSMHLHVVEVRRGTWRVSDV